ncbi:MAG TPA: CPBP family intramembrane glutamic endopeptidase [Candidatus Angelobacter sp.]|nr:CPBP family intramembrane glutamic endopeptidase [Candidatus Angelobacter sp.]
MGTAESAITLFVLARWFLEATQDSLPRAAFIGVACLSPILEEILFRGLFLRSMKAYVPGLRAALIVPTLAAAGHQNFVTALPGQLVLCLVYLRLGNSLPASVAAHIANNAWAVYWMHMVR